MSSSPLDRAVRFFLENKLFVFLLLAGVVAGGVLVAPFDWKLGGVPRSPIAVDAIPDIGENQQIVFTEWAGRSPQDVDDQITYPLTAALLGIPKVKTVRSFSNFGFSSIYVIFHEDADWDWSRAKLLEKLSSLPMGTLPPEVSPSLGPDATALGQVFWYTLEGRDEEGNPASGWTPEELRSIQDYYVRYRLQAVSGVAEVASVGGFLREYQIDVDPDAMRAYGVTLDEVFRAVRESNTDVGARSIEINKVEYIVRGRGFLKGVEDLRETVVAVNENVPITLRQIANIEKGPALRRGILDKGGAEAVGGVVVARYGANPMATIQNVREKIAQITPGLPVKTLEDGTVSKVAIVPFYDRSGLIEETLDTLSSALWEEALVTILVVILLVWHIRSSLLISVLLPLAVLFTFVAMRIFKVDANIVALSGIAIAIGTIVDMGIVICENVLKRGERGLAAVYEGTREVSGAVLTAVLTTVIGFLPVFAMRGAEGKLFHPLAFTKTFALIAAMLIALLVLPALAHLLFRKRWDRLFEKRRPTHRIVILVLAFAVALILAGHWLPLGLEAGLLNHLFVIVMMGGFLGATWAFMRSYERFLRFFLARKEALLAIVAAVMVAGVAIWGSLGREFMPALDEGSFLFMPSTMPHASIGEAEDVLRMQNMAFSAIPEVDGVVGKVGRVESSLDPAPVSMIETLISYKPEYGKNEDGERVRLWRDHIGSPDDIWEEIVRAGEVLGVTSSPKLQPIQTRLIMLQTGMRSPMGLKVSGPDLATIEEFGLELERALRNFPLVDAATVFADRIVGKPYLEIDIDRRAIARYGISVKKMQDVIEVAVGGRRVTTTVEGRERYPVRVRYMRELRDTIEDLETILVPAPDGTQIPLRQMAQVEYVRGPQMIKSEDTFLMGYVIFDRVAEFAEGDVMEGVLGYLGELESSGALVVPAGVAYKPTGSYEQQKRASATLLLILPVTLLLIFVIIYLLLRRVSTTLLVFSGVFVAWSGGFILIWLYNEPWFMNTAWLGFDLRGLLQIGEVNLSIAVWVGFLALFGIATDDGVLMATYLKQRFEKDRPSTVREVQEATVSAAVRRNRPAMMTTATTLLALLPVLMSTGRGADVMVPMAIPTFGGMAMAILTVFVVPVFYCWIEEFRLKTTRAQSDEV